MQLSQSVLKEAYTTFTQNFKAIYLVILHCSYAMYVHNYVNMYVHNYVNMYVPIYLCTCNDVLMELFTIKASNAFLKVQCTDGHPLSPQI